MKQQNRIDKTKSGFLFVLFKRIRSMYQFPKLQIQTNKTLQNPIKFLQNFLSNQLFLFTFFGIEKWYVKTLVLWIKDLWELLFTFPFIKIH